LYEEFYDAFMHAPVPPELLGAGNDEKREIYFEELRKNVRILLEKSLRWNEQNLLMMERLGVQNEWRDKTKLAYAKVQRLLDPSAPMDAPDPAAAPSVPAAAPPPLPQPPGPRPDVGPDSAPADHLAPGGDQPPSEDRPKPPVQGPTRQIL
jgi:hypothetical protein